MYGRDRVSEETRTGKRGASERPGEMIVGGKHPLLLGERIQRLIEFGQVRRA